MSAGSVASSLAPTTAMSWPSTTRDDDFKTSIAFLRNCPAPGDTLTPGAEPIQTANGRELSAASSSGSSSTVPASQPRSGGDACTVTSSFGAAVPRANVRPLRVMRYVVESRDRKRVVTDPRGVQRTGRASASVTARLTGGASDGVYNNSCASGSDGAC